MTELKEGDILQRGLFFYRVYMNNTGKGDIVMNKIIYNFKTEKLQIFHDYTYTNWNEVGEGKMYTVLDSENKDTVAKLELVKRKYKLQKLNNISDGNS